MYYYPFSPSSPWQYHYLYSDPRIISVNPYFYPYSSSYSRSFEEMWQSYNSSLREAYCAHLTRIAPYTLWTPVGWESSRAYGVQPPPRPGFDPIHPKYRAKRTIEEKWKSLGGAPGAAIFDIEELGSGYRIRYQNGAIYTKRPGGPAFWVYGAIGQKYDELGGVGSWLGFPISDEEPLDEQGGRVSRFEKGEIYWWNDTGPIEMNEVVLSYKGIHCFGTTDGPGRDDIYAIFSVISPGAEPSTGMTRLYRNVDDKQSVPDNIELYLGKPWGLALNFVLFERDQGDPNVYKGMVEKAVDLASAGIGLGVGAIATPAAGAAVGAGLKLLQPLISKEINNLLGTADDFLGEYTITLSRKDIVLMAARQNEMIHNNSIHYKFETHLLSGDGGSYKGYFNLKRV